MCSHERRRGFSQHDHLHQQSQRKNQTRRSILSLYLLPLFDFDFCLEVAALVSDLNLHAFRIWGKFCCLLSMLFLCIVVLLVVESVVLLYNEKDTSFFLLFGGFLRKKLLKAQPIRKKKDNAFGDF